jgi:hypothetical protein
MALQPKPTNSISGPNRQFGPGTRRSPASITGPTRGPQILHPEAQSNRQITRNVPDGTNAQALDGSIARVPQHANYGSH